MSLKHGTGRSRGRGDGSENEDSYFTDDQLGLYVVCDGAGGAEAGEVASRIAIDAVSSYIEEHRGASADLFTGFLATRAVRAAFRAIMSTERLTPEFRGMNTTMTLLLFRGRRAVIGHVGDSRLYLARNGALDQLTVDHALTDRTAGNPLNDATPEVDTFRLAVETGDIFFLCSDGMNQVMEQEDLVLSLACSENLGRVAEQLLEKEEALGLDGDATVVIVRVDEENDRTRLLHHVSRDYELYQGFQLAA